MPIYEFKCTKCEEFFEVIAKNSSDESEVKCPKCASEQFERVVSTTNYKMGGAKGSKGAAPSKQERNCSQGSCTTYTVPGEA
ncbi:MAG: zinc ribbon domain-containing protein [Desulfobacteraceae bacterium]